MNSDRYAPLRSVSPAAKRVFMRRRATAFMFPWLLDPNTVWAKAETDRFSNMASGAQWQIGVRDNA